MATSTQLQGKTALVTGASSGIGLAIAQVLAENGADLILTARREERLQKLATELQEQHGVKVNVFAADLATPDAPQHLFQQIESENLRIDLLVNNAGFGSYGPFLDLDLDGELSMINLNISALVALTRLCLPAMVNRESGYVLNVASTAAYQPGPFMAVYFATKAFVLHFSEAVNEELKGTGVSVTALCPGPTESEFGDVAGVNESAMFAGKKLPTSAAVARDGLKATLARKPILIHGFSNWMLAQSVRFTPRSVVTGIIRGMTAPKSN
jgi:hypothetical protein